MKPEQNPDQNKIPQKPSKNGRPNIFWVYAIILLAIFAIQFYGFTPSPKTIYWDELKKMLVNQDIKRIIVVNKEKAEIYLKEDRIKDSTEKELYKTGTPNTGPQYIYNISSPEVFQKRLEDAQKNLPEDERILFESETRRDIWGEILAWILPLGLIILVWVWMFKRMGAGSSGVFNIGKSRAKIFDKNGKNIKVTFNDVAGLEEAKLEVTEIVDFLKNPEKYTRLGGKIPKGALLVGPPGTGKTLLAKAVAGEADVPFFSMSGSDFVEMFVGVGASRVRDLFAQAKAKAPCIIFIDEIDAIGRARGKNANFSANDERENTLNQLLTEMDGFDTNTGVIILAATNRVDVLDPALLRAGRFDRQIMIELPDLNERREIFKVHIRPLKIDKTLDINFLAKQTPGFSGADIANVCNEAALIAARKGKETIQKDDFLDAIDKIIGGLEKKNKIITSKEKRTIAYHEAGHATVSWLLKYASPLIKVTIVPRGKALGAAWYLPEERQLTTKEQMLDEICALLGGRASEEINFNEISTGALNDLERATKQAYSMVAYFGMSPKLKNVSFYDSSGRYEYSFVKPFSEKTAEIIDSEVNNIINEQYQRAVDIIKQNIDGLKKLAEKLLEEEVIFTEDVENIFGKREFSSPEHEEALYGIKLALNDKQKNEQTEQIKSKQEEEQQQSNENQSETNTNSGDEQEST